MKTLRKMLALMLILCFCVPAVTAAESTELSSGVKNIVRRAYQQVELEWTPLVTVYGWQAQFRFEAGETYRGIPYGQPYEAGAYMPFNEDAFNVFLKAVDNPQSSFYLKRSEGGGSSLFYASDCSAFASYCYGIRRINTKEIATGNRFTTVKTPEEMEIGDCINKQGKHVMVITDIREEMGTMIYEVCQQTPPIATRSEMTAEELERDYLSQGFRIRRFNKRDQVQEPYAVTYVPSVGTGE